MNPENERVKKRYFRYLKEAEGLSDLTIGHAASIVYQYEQFTDFSGFKEWTTSQAIAYKDHLRAEQAERLLSEEKMGT